MSSSAGAPIYVDGTAKPYLGPHSYGAQHQHLFFGRQGAGATVVAMALSQRVSLLHAVSGAGKTSLLGARVIPQLEDRGWIAVYSRPGNDPSASLKVSVLDRTLPPPSLEVRAIDRLSTFLGGLGGGPDWTLRRAKETLQAKDVRAQEGYVEVLSPLAGDESGGSAANGSASQILPFFVRFLQAGRGPWLLAKHLLALDTFRANRVWPDHSVAMLADALARTSLSELRSFFASPDIERVHGESRSFLEDAANGSLVEFFTRLVEFWGRHVDRFGVVLVLDQFEELFTRFVDKKKRSSSDDTLADVGLRSKYFGGLSEMLESRAATVDGSLLPLPVRIVVSMRDDHIACLDEFESATVTIDRAARHHLRLLDVREAEAAIRRPAEIFGFRDQDGVFSEILEDLPTEQDQVEPGHIQIVCDRLWAESVAAGGSSHSVSKKMLRDLGGVDGILDTHFTRFLGSYEDEFERFDVLDMLEPLITAGGRRNIVEVDRILNAPYRKPGSRERLLEDLKRVRIVRVESRLKDNFVEITHEFLIEPILREIRATLRTSARWRDLEQAFRSLESLERDGFRGERRNLEKEELEVLLSVRGGLDLDGNPWIREVFYRSAVLNRSAAEIMKALREDLDSQVRLVDLAKLQLEIDDRIMTERLLDPWEIEVLVESGAGAIEERLAAFLLRSVIVRTPTGQGDLIRTVVRRCS